MVVGRLNSVTHKLQHNKLHKTTTPNSILIQNSIRPPLLPILKPHFTPLHYPTHTVNPAPTPDALEASWKLHSVYGHWLNQ